MVDTDGTTHSFSVKEPSSDTDSVDTMRVMQTESEVTGMALDTQKGSDLCWGKGIHPKFLIHQIQLLGRNRLTLFAASLLAMMYSWKLNKPDMTIEDILKIPPHPNSPTWLEIYNGNKGLEFDRSPEFYSDFGLVAENAEASLPIQKYIQWMNDYGPLWFVVPVSHSFPDSSILLLPCPDIN